MQEHSKRRLDKSGSTIFILLTLIVGIYGMNLLNMPEYACPLHLPHLVDRNALYRRRISSVFPEKAMVLKVRTFC